MQKWKLSRKIYLAYVFVPCLAPKSHARSALIDKKIGLNFAPEKAGGGGGGGQTFRSSVGVVGWVGIVATAAPCDPL